MKIRLNISAFLDISKMSFIRIIPILLNILIIKFLIDNSKNELDDYIYIVTNSLILCTFSNYGVLTYLMKFKRRGIYKITSIFIGLKKSLFFILFLISFLSVIINNYFSSYIEKYDIYDSITFFLVLVFYGVNNLNSFYFNSINKPTIAFFFRFSIISLVFYLMLIIFKQSVLYCFFFSTLLSVIFSYLLILKSINYKLNFRNFKNLNFLNFIFKNKHFAFSSISSALMFVLPLYLFIFVHKSDEIFLFYFITKVCSLFFLFSAIIENKFIYDYSRLFVEKKFKKIKNYLYIRSKLILSGIVLIIGVLTIFQQFIFNYFLIEFKYINLYFFSIAVCSLYILIGPVNQYLLFSNSKIYYKKIQYILYISYFILSFYIILKFNFQLIIYLILSLFLLHNTILAFIFLFKLNKKNY